MYTKCHSLLYADHSRLMDPNPRSSCTHAMMIPLLGSLSNTLQNGGKELIEREKKGLEVELRAAPVAAFGVPLELSASTPSAHRTQVLQEMAQSPRKRDRQRGDDRSGGALSRVHPFSSAPTCSPLGRKQPSFKMKEQQ